MLQACLQSVDLKVDRHFGEGQDTIDHLQRILKHHFEDVQVRQHNTVALFAARAPIDAA